MAWRGDREDEGRAELFLKKARPSGRYSREDEGRADALYKEPKDGWERRRSQQSSEGRFDMGRSERRIG